MLLLHCHNDIVTFLHSSIHQLRSTWELSKAKRVSFLRKFTEEKYRYGSFSCDVIKILKSNL